MIHDLEPLLFAEPDAEQPIDPAKADQMLAQLSADDGGFRELQLMREEGVIKAFGAGVNAPESGECPVAKAAWNTRYVAHMLAAHEQTGRRSIDFFLLANMYSLLNHSAHELGILDDCLHAGVSVVVGGPYSSGILAVGADPSNGADHELSAPHSKSQICCVEQEQLYFTTICLLVQRFCIGLGALRRCALGMVFH